MFNVGDRVRYEWESGVATGWIVDLIINRPEQYLVAWTDVHTSIVDGSDLEHEWK